jgi:DNA-binding transcriptional regulator YhcF (GntR family)
MATEAAVNPNTLQKTLSELKRDGLVYTQRTSGRFVTTDEKMIQQVKKDLTYEQIEQFLKKMACLGYTREETLALVESKVKK